MNTKSRQVDVSELLESIAVSEILYCPNPGNAGDSAIAAATYQLFDRMGLQYRFVEWDDDFDASGKTVVYGGGGNLVEKYPHARSFIERHHESAERLVVLPHTIYGHGDLLHQLGRNVFLFCRERRSFEWVRKQTEGPTVYLADDLAFALNTREVLGRELFDGTEAAKQTGATLLQSIRKRCIPNSEVPVQALGLRKAANISYNVFGSLAGRDRSVLYALRTDKERTAATLPSTNVVFQSCSSTVRPHAQSQNMQRQRCCPSSTASNAS